MGAGVIPERATGLSGGRARQGRGPRERPTLGFVDEFVDEDVGRPAPAPGPAGGTTLAPARPTPDLDDGDHDRMAHIVLEGYTPKDGEFVSTGPSVVEGMVNRTPVRALCGKEWVPGRDPARYGLCPTCKEIAESMGWKIPAG